MEHDEKWLLSKGWKKFEGYRVDHDVFSEGDYSFFESVEDFCRKCIYYVNPKNDEEAYEEIDDCIERQEEYDEDDE
jgi:hypothetical protein